MKNRFMRTASLIVAIAVVLALAPAAEAATNTGTGDIGGVALTPDSFDLNSTQLALAKRAYLAATGTALGDGDNLPIGTQVKFLVLMNNLTAISADDVTVQDVLDSSFAYNTTTMVASELAGSAATWCPAGVCDYDAIFTEVDTNGTALGDGDAVQAPTDADVGSWTSGTTTLDWGDGNNANNAPLNVSADSVWAVVFTVTMQ